MWSQRIKILVIAISLLGLSAANAAGMQYKKHKITGCVVHVVSLNPKDYNVEIIKAQGTRDTVPVMAKRVQADIAINGGFFNMGATQDGSPTGSLVIHHKVYKIKNITQALVIINAGMLSIQSVNSKDYLKQHLNSEVSLVSGIPLLINHGNITENIFAKKGDFYTKPHARTALGIKSDGTIMICLAEHLYAQDLTSISMREMYSLFKKTRSIDEIKKALKKKLTLQDTTQGLTIIELANFMKKLGCEFAINLDGGGSSTLWIDGKVINNTIGDADESYGLQIVRPVCDAIVFKKKGVFTHIN